METFDNNHNRCDLCGEECGEGFHDCPMPDPGDVFAQPYSYEFSDNEE